MKEDTMHLCRYDTALLRTACGAVAKSHLFGLLLTRRPMKVTCKRCINTRRWWHAVHAGRGAKALIRKRKEEGTLR